MATPRTIQSVNRFIVQQYGESTEILSLAKRIKIMVPGGNKLTDAEAQALAQVSLVTQCNPFIGEVWYISGSGPMIGIKGARRHGNQQIEEAGGKQAYWTPTLTPCSGEEAGYKGDIKNLAAAWKCTITDSVSTTAFQKLFVETVSAMRAAGDPDPVGTAKEICGKRPEWVGYGFATVEEKTRMNKQTAARKRAEAEALKQKFDIPFGVGSGDTAEEAGAPEWIEGKATTPTTQQPEIVPALMTYEQAADTTFQSALGTVLLGSMSAEILNNVYLSESTSEEQKTAAALILKHDFQMDPPEAPKRTVEQLKGQMGFGN